MPIMAEDKDKAEVQQEKPSPSEISLKEANSFFVTKISIMSLATIMVSVVFVLLISIFHPDVSNDKIFEVIGPAFQTVVGCFVGMVSANFIRK
jgi:hypothetical protein